MSEGNRINTIYFLIPFTILFTIILFDTAVNRAYLYRPSGETEYSNFNVFILLAATSVFLQFFIVVGTRSRLRDAKITQWLTYSKLSLFVLAGNSAIAIILAVIIFDIWSTSSYNLYALIATMWSSYGIGLGTLTILVIRFFGWFITGKNKGILLYALAILAILLNASANLTISTLLLNGQPVIQYETRGTISLGLGSQPIILLNAFFSISSIVSFILMWLATAFFLRIYSDKLGRPKYWFLMSLPLVYFLVQFQPIFLEALYFIDTTTLARLYTQVFSASKAVGGILFATSFWIIGRKLGNQNVVQTFMLISGFGLAILFGSNQGILLSNTPYPPFGLFTVSIFGLASYLTLVGIYYSAISVSQDSALRRSIRKSVQEQINLIDLIGKAEVEKTITRNAMKVYNSFSEEINFKPPPSLTEEDIERYIGDVMKELKKESSKTSQ